MTKKPTHKASIKVKASVYKKYFKGPLNKSDNEEEEHLLEHTLVFYGGCDCKGEEREREWQNKSEFMDTSHRLPNKDPIKSDKPNSETVEPKRVTTACLDPEGPKNA